MYDQVQEGIAGSERRAAPRLGRSFVALAICFALAAVAACVRIPRPAPTVNDAITTRAQGTGLAKAFGIAFGDELARMTPTDLNTVLDDAVRVGITSVRMDVSWATVQWTAPRTTTGPGSTRPCALPGSGVWPYCRWLPTRLRGRACPAVAASPAHRVNRSRFAAFAALAAKRYAPLGVHNWEIWNEENAAGGWPPLPTR